MTSNYFQSNKNLTNILNNMRRKIRYTCTTFVMRTFINTNIFNYWKRYSTQTNKDGLIFPITVRLLVKTCRRQG